MAGQPGDEGGPGGRRRCRFERRFGIVGDGIPTLDGRQRLARRDLVRKDREIGIGGIEAAGATPRDAFAQRGLLRGNVDDHERNRKFPGMGIYSKQCFRKH